MNPTYRSQFTESRIRETLLDASNLPVLEEILDTEISKLRKLKTAPLPKSRSKKEIEAFSYQVLEDVNSYLGTTTPENLKFKFVGKDKWIAAVSLAGAAVSGLMLSIPSWEPGFPLWLAGTFSAITLLGGHILNTVYLSPVGVFNEEGYECILPKDASAETIAHEYAHALTRSQGFGFKDFRTFGEGFAIQIEEKISNEYAQRQNNPALTQFITKRNIEELRRGYLYICKELGIKPRKDIRRLKPVDSLFLFQRLTKRATPAYDLGNTFFKLLERKYGPSLYRDIIQGNYPQN